MPKRPSLPIIPLEPAPLDPPRPQLWVLFVILASAFGIAAVYYVATRVVLP